MATATESLTEYCQRIAREAKEASRRLATLPGQTRDRALHLAAQRLRTNAPSILSANELDLASAPQYGLSGAMVDRLRLTKSRLEEMARAVEEIAAAPDPIGRVIEGSIRPNGLQIHKVRVPLGVVLFIYESRPNVTSDAAALCIKSGNSVILRGGKEAIHSNQAVAEQFNQAMAEAGVPSEAVAMVDVTDRAAVGELLKLDACIDVAIPRGGEELIRRVVAEATMPVLKHYKGVCHVYLDASAELEPSRAIIENAKCQRPGVCNAAETLLVHADAAERLLPPIAQRLIEKGVELRGCERTCELVPQARPAKESDYGFEFLDLILAVRVVDDLESAMEHIARYSSGHTEAIVTKDLQSARTFTAGVDSSAVMVNASTRFNDGGQFGLGAEIGISTDKFHARGPCGLTELTSYKYVVFGDGHVRP